MATEKAKAAQARNLADIERYFADIRGIIKQYARLVERLTAMKNDKKQAVERMELATEREGLKEKFIQKKKAARANIGLLPETTQPLKEKELKDLQEEYRQIDSDFRNLGIVVDRAALFEGRGGDGFDPSRATNDELLDKAKAIEDDNSSKLQSGLSTLVSTKEQAKYTAAQLEQGRETIDRINKGLDDVTSELALSKTLITNFMKRIATDKVIIAFTALLVLGLAGIIIYASLNPNQKLFSVPDAAKPSVPGVTTSSTAVSPTPSPRV